MKDKIGLYESLKRTLMELETDEKKIINIKDLNKEVNLINKEIELTEKVNDIYKEKTFDVLTDGQMAWVSLEDMNEIRLALPQNMHILFDYMPEDNYVHREKTYLKMTLDQIKLINKYTFDPKYVPKLRLITEKEPLHIDGDGRMYMSR